MIIGLLSFSKRQTAIEASSGQRMEDPAPEPPHMSTSNPPASNNLHPTTSTAESFPNFCTAFPTRIRTRPPPRPGCGRIDVDPTNTFTPHPNKIYRKSLSTAESTSRHHTPPDALRAFHS